MRTLAVLALSAALAFAGSGIALAAEESDCAAEDAINVLTCVHVHDIHDVVELDLDDLDDDA